MCRVDIVLQFFSYDMKSPLMLADFPSGGHRFVCRRQKIDLWGRSRQDTTSPDGPPTFFLNRRQKIG